MATAPIRNPVFSTNTSLRVITSTPVASSQSQGSKESRSPQNEEAAVFKLSDEGRRLAGLDDGASQAEKSQDVSAKTESTVGPSKLSGAKGTETSAAQTSEGSSEGTEQTEGAESEEADHQETQQLKKRDREVRAHEQAHLGALGAYRSGGASFQFETGPDGQRYAVSGEVPVDVSEGRTPEETIRKMQTIRRAALAPADPSGADRQVAAQASQIEAQARSELAKPAEESEKSGAPSEASATDDEIESAAADSSSQTGGTTDRRSEVSRKFPPLSQSTSRSSSPRVDVVA